MRHILIIDDDAEALGRIRNLLREEGYSLSRGQSDSELASLLLQRSRMRSAIPSRSVGSTATTASDASASPPLLVARRQSRGPAFRSLKDDDTARPHRVIGLEHLRRAGSQEPENLFDEDGLEHHAASRWSRTVVRLIESPKDPRTIAIWARWIAASPGAIRNWCRIVGISARNSLTFGRMLRAIVLSAEHNHHPENLLDVVDKRTLSRLLRNAGIDEHHPWPIDVNQFISRQQFIRDQDALAEVSRALVERNRAQSISA